MCLNEIKEQCKRSTKYLFTSCYIFEIYRLRGITEKKQIKCLPKIENLIQKENLLWDKFMLIFESFWLFLVTKSVNNSFWYPPPSRLIWLQMFGLTLCLYSFEWGAQVSCEIWITMAAYNVLNERKRTKACTHTNTQKKLWMVCGNEWIINIL